MAKVKFITSLLFILIFNFNLQAKEINTKELKKDLKTPKEDSKKIESQKEDNKKEAKKEKPKAEPKTLSPSVAPQVPAVPTVPPVPSVPKVQAAEKKEAKLKPKPSHQKPGEPLVTILFMDWNALDVFLIKMDANKIYYCKNKNELSAYKTGKGKSHSSSFDEILDINFHGLKNKGVQKIQGILKASMDDVDIYKDLDIAVDLDFNSPREVPNQKKPDNTGTIKLGLGEKYRKNTKNYTLEFDFGLSLDFDSTRDGKNQTEAIIKIEDKSSISSMSGVSSSQSSSNPQASTSSASHTATSHGPSGGSSSQGMSSVPGLGSASLTYSAYLKEKLFLFGQGLFSYSTEKIGDKDQDPYLGAMFGGGIGRINNITETKKVESVEKYLKESGLLKKAFSRKIKKAIAILFSKSANSEDALRKLAPALNKFGFIKDGQALEIDTVFELAEILNEAFKERQSGYILRLGLRKDLKMPNENQEKSMFFVTTFMYFKPLSDKTQFRHNAIFLKSISGDTKISTLNFETEIETLLNHYSGLSLGHNLSLYKYEFKGNESDWIKSMVLKGALKAFLNEKIDISANINMDFQEVGPDKKKEFNPQTTIKIMLEYDII